MAWKYVRIGRLRSVCIKHGEPATMGWVYKVTGTWRPRRFSLGAELETVALFEAVDGTTPERIGELARDALNAEREKEKEASDWHERARRVVEQAV